MCDSSNLEVLINSFVANLENDLCLIRYIKKKSK